MGRVDFEGGIVVGFFFIYLLGLFEGMVMFGGIGVGVGFCDVNS